MERLSAMDVLGGEAGGAVLSCWRPTLPSLAAGTFRRRGTDAPRRRRRESSPVTLTLLNAVSHSTRSPGRERPSPWRMLSKRIFMRVPKRVDANEDTTHRGTPLAVLRPVCTAADGVRAGEC
eukprot:2009825-Prymnesium_polylepis.1